MESILFLIFLTSTSSKLTANCGRDKCAFKVNEEAWLLAVADEISRELKVGSFERQVENTRLANELGARTLQTTDVQSFGENDKQTIAGLYDVLSESNGGFWVLDTEGHRILLREPLFGFKQRWLEGVLLHFQCGTDSWDQILLAASQTENGWHYFKEKMLEELQMFKSFLKKLEKDKDKTTTIDTQFIITAKPELYLIDITFGRLGRQANFDTIECFIKFLQTHIPQASD